MVRFIASILFVSMLHYCANLKTIRYESTSLDRIVADKSHHRSLRNTEFRGKSVWCFKSLRLQLHGAIYRPDFFVVMLVIVRF